MEARLDYAKLAQEPIKAMYALGGYLARCGLEGPHRWFNPSYGGMLCTTCRVPGSASPAPETVTLLGALLTGDWPAVEAADPRHLKEASGLVSAFLAWHVERGLRSMAYVER